MKKRAMKKWIPKKTCYCYNVDKYGNRKNCKWLRFNENKVHQDNGYCMFLKTGDWFKEGTMLLWDGCKECGISDY